MPRKRIFVLSACLVPALTAGCVTLGTGSSDVLMPVMTPVVSDVPQPIGFELDKDESRFYDKLPGGARVVDHVYKGRASLFRVKEFYEEQMLSYRWVRIGGDVSEGVLTLDFEKDKDRCHIRATERGLFGTVHVRIKIKSFDRKTTSSGR